MAGGAGDEFVRLEVLTVASRYNDCMTLNIEQVPQAVEAALTRRAAEQGKSVPEVAIELMAQALGVEPSPKKRDLSRYQGTWIEDPAVDEALKQFERVDEDQWR